MVTYQVIMPKYFQSQSEADTGMALSVKKQKVYLEETVSTAEGKSRTDKKESKSYFRIILIFKFYIIYCNTHERHLCFDHLILNIMLMKKLLLYILIGGILLIGTYGCANYEEDLLDEISPKQMLATVTTEIELADAVYHRDTVLDPAAE